MGKVIEELALEVLPKSRASVQFRPSAAELALSFRWSSLVGAPPDATSDHRRDLW